MLVLIPESNFSIQTSRKAKELFNSISFMNWIYLCILLRLLKKTSTEEGSAKVQNSSLRIGRRRWVGEVGSDFKGFINDVVNDDVSH